MAKANRNQISMHMFKRFDAAIRNMQTSVIPFCYESITVRDRAFPKPTGPSPQDQEYLAQLAAAAVPAPAHAADHLSRAIEESGLGEYFHDASEIPATERCPGEDKTNEQPTADQQRESLPSNLNGHRLAGSVFPSDVSTTQSGVDLTEDVEPHCSGRAEGNGQPHLPDSRPLNAGANRQLASSCQETCPNLLPQTTSKNMLRTDGFCADSISSLSESSSNGGGQPGAKFRALDIDANNRQELQSRKRKAAADENESMPKVSRRLEFIDRVSKLLRMMQDEVAPAFACVTVVLSDFCKEMDRFEILASRADTAFQEFFSPHLREQGGFTVATVFQKLMQNDKFRSIPSYLMLITGSDDVDLVGGLKKPTVDVSTFVIRLKKVQELFSQINATLESTICKPEIDFQDFRATGRKLGALTKRLQF